MNKLQLYKSAHILCHPLTQGQIFVAASVGFVWVWGSADNLSGYASNTSGPKFVCFLGGLCPCGFAYIWLVWFFSWVKSDLFRLWFELLPNVLLNVLTATRPLWNLIRLLRRSRATFHLILSGESSWRHVPDKKKYTRRCCGHVDRLLVYFGDAMCVMSLFVRFKDALQSKASIQRQSLGYCTLKG